MYQTNKRSKRTNNQHHKNVSLSSFHFNGQTLKLTPPTDCMHNTRNTSPCPQRKYDRSDLPRNGFQHVRCIFTVGESKAELKAKEYVRCIEHKKQLNIVNMRCIEHKKQLNIVNMRCIEHKKQLNNV